MPSSIVQSMVGDGKRHIEGNAVVEGGERLEIGADFVADIAACSGPVSAGDAEIDLPVLHQVTAHIIDDNRMRDAVAVQLPGGQASSRSRGRVSSTQTCRSIPSSKAL